MLVLKVPRDWPSGFGVEASYLTVTPEFSVQGGGLRNLNFRVLSSVRADYYT